MKYRLINKHYYYYGLDRKDSESLDKYMPDKIFDEIRDKINEQGKLGKFTMNYVCVLRDKFLFGKYLQSLGLPVPKITAICDSTAIQWFDPARIEPLESILNHEGLDCFLKPLLGEIGRDVFPVRVCEGKLYMGKEQADINRLKSVIKDRVILQERIIQHPDLQKLYAQSLNTLRIVTIQRDGAIEVLGTILRTGANGSYIDNWSSGGLALGTDAATGRVSGSGTYDLPFGKRADVHPTTGVKFDGFEIPYFKESVELAKEVHRYFYGIHSIGWDIAITQSGPLCIEGNENWGMPIMQVFDSGLISRYFESLQKTNHFVGGKTDAYWGAKGA
jgi:hypothetical protein